MKVPSEKLTSCFCSCFLVFYSFLSQPTQWFYESKNNVVVYLFFLPSILFSLFKYEWNWVHRDSWMKKNRDLDYWFVSKVRTWNNFKLGGFDFIEKKVEIHEFLDLYTFFCAKILPSHSYLHSAPSVHSIFNRVILKDPKNLRSKSGGYFVVSRVKYVPSLYTMKSNFFIQLIIKVPTITW